MWRILGIVCSGLIIAACGGDSGSIDSYEAGVEAHTKVMTEMVKVLEGVTDEASANKAAAEIEELGGRLASISAQMAELPRPGFHQAGQLHLRDALADKVPNAGVDFVSPPSRE